jgi:hypothetical protein
MASRRRRQRGQALLLVLVFLAAFLVLIAAALRLASASFLRQSSVVTDTRETYALDAGVAYGMEYARFIGRFCTPSFNPPTFTLNYPTGNVTVTVAMTAPATCTNANPVSDVRVTATGTARTVRARLVQNPPGGANPWTIAWQAYQ